MVLLDISLQARVIIGISGMVVLFAGFLVVFISNQRKKIQYHKNLQLIFEDEPAARPPALATAALLLMDSIDILKDLELLHLKPNLY